MRAKTSPGRERATDERSQLKNKRNYKILLTLISRPVTELVERVNHGEVSLQAQRYCHVDAGSDAGLG